MSLFQQRLMQITSALVFGACVAQASVAQAETPEEFYRGKKINLIIGSSAGGGYDVYARLISRYFSKHMPGNPQVVASNMPGAGSNAAAAYLAASAPKDGTVMAALYMGAVVEPLFYGKKRATHDPSQFQYIGNANTDHNVCLTMAGAPLKSMGEATSKELVLGASAPGGATYDYPAFEKELLGFKIKIVSGYPGSREVNLAVEKGEVHGVCGQSWGGVAAQYEPLVKSGAIRILAQESNTGHATLNALGIPLMRDFATSDYQRQVLNVFYGQSSFSRPYAVAKEVPADRVAALRKAFIDTMRDPELAAEAKKMRLDIEATAGEELQAKLHELYSAPMPVISGIRKVYAEK